MRLLLTAVFLTFLPICTLSAQVGSLRAFVVGNTAYTGEGFPDLGEAPKNDVREMKKALRGVGFDKTNIDDQLNLNLQQFRNMIEEFRGRVGPDDTVLFYYSGHGFSMGGANYLVPTGFQFRETRKEAEDESIPLTYVLNRLSNGRSLIVILDACRTAAPLLKSIEDASQRNVHGLADLKFPGGLIAYSTSDGKASTAEGPDHMSLYTYQLKLALSRHPASLQDALNDAKAKTIDVSGTQQIPAVYDALGGTVALNGGAHPGPNPAPTTMPLYTSITQSAQWTSQDNGAETDWAGAKQYCDALTLGNKSDWRVPTKEELQGLHRDEYNKGGLPPAFHLSGNVIWSSSILSSDGQRDYRWRWDTHKDLPVTEFKRLARVLCIRTDIQIVVDRVLEMAINNHFGGWRGMRRDTDLPQWIATVTLPDAQNCNVWTKNNKSSNRGFDASDHVYVCFFFWDSGAKEAVRSKLDAYIRAADGKLEPNLGYYVNPDGVKIQIEERKENFALRFFPPSLTP